MRKLLKSPIVNAVCISLFTAFYWCMLGWKHMGAAWLEPYDGGAAFWSLWSGFLSDGGLTILAHGMVGVTVLVVILLLLRRRPHDEYHTEMLANCLVVSIVIALLAIAGFYWLIRIEPLWIVGKFTLFIVVHWVTVVLANLVYVLLCRWR